MFFGNFAKFWPRNVFSEKFAKFGSETEVFGFCGKFGSEIYFTEISQNSSQEVYFPKISQKFGSFPRFCGYDVKLVKYRSHFGSRRECERCARPTQAQGRASLLPETGRRGCFGTCARVLRSAASWSTRAPARVRASFADCTPRVCPPVLGMRMTRHPMMIG